MDVELSSVLANEHLMLGKQRTRSMYDVWRFFRLSSSEVRRLLAPFPPVFTMISFPPSPVLHAVVYFVAITI